MLPALWVFLQLNKFKFKVEVQLLLAKSRLAPLAKKGKEVSIPRLELLGCLIGSRLCMTVVESLKMQNVERFFWSDSSTALSWIRRNLEWGTFVGNRVREINKLTHATEWRHVPGKKNPADLPSRGCSPSELLESRWWEGPEWLMDSRDTWPSCEVAVDEDEVMHELRKTAMATCAIGIVEPTFSSYAKNVRVAAWVRRFVTNARAKKIDCNFSASLEKEEKVQAEKDIFRQIQQQHFSAEQRLKNLQLERRDGLFCIKTRLLNSVSETTGFRYPVLLPNKDLLVDQMIREVHIRHCHAGAQFVLGKLREHVWILQGRKAVNRVIRNCVVCRRQSCKPLECDPAPLPVKRIEANYAFETTGVDLAGPIILKSGKKCWIVLYTCAVYRGVYLDIVDSISTDEFLDSLEKFTLIVGRPTTMMSDNGTNFVGAHNMMNQLNWKWLEPRLKVRKLQWTFNPPTAAWWGGFWERLVRTLKELLRKMVGSAKLTRKELEKCLAAVSYTINNRPLTTLTEDPEDLEPLTPYMFMKDLPIAGLPERDFITGKDLQEAHRKLRDIKSAFKERFRKEYLSIMVQRKNEKKTPRPKIGDVVLVGSDNRKRFEWPLGKVLEIFPGADGKPRTAKIKTAHGTLIRPFQRLYPLEVSSAEPMPVPNAVVSSRTTCGAAEEKVITKSGREVKKPRRYAQWNS